MNSEKKAKLFKEKYLEILGALIILLVSSLLYIGRDWDLTTYRWFLASLIICAFCGLALNKKSLVKTSQRYLALITLISVIMIIITRDFWTRSCFGGLIPPMLLFLPLLATLVVFIVSALIIFITKKIIKLKQESKISENLEV
jgi:hypothetical protein